MSGYSVDSQGFRDALDDHITGHYGEDQFDRGWDEYEDSQRVADDDGDRTMNMRSVEAQNAGRIAMSYRVACPVCEARPGVDCTDKGQRMERRVHSARIESLREDSRSPACSVDGDSGYEIAGDR
jgi:hypothetical protein